MHKKSVHIFYYTKDISNYIKSINNTSYYDKKHKKVYIDITLVSSFVDGPSIEYGLSTQITGIFASLKSNKYWPKKKQLLAINENQSGNGSQITQHTLILDTKGNISTNQDNPINIGGNTIYHIYGSYKFN